MNSTNISWLSVTFQTLEFYISKELGSHNIFLLYAIAIIYRLKLVHARNVEVTAFCIYNHTLNLKRSIYEKINMSRVHYGQAYHLGTDHRQGAVLSNLTWISSQNIKPWHLHLRPSKVHSEGWSIIWSISPYQSCGLLVSQKLMISKKESSPL